MYKIIDIYYSMKLQKIVDLTTYYFKKEGERFVMSLINENLSGRDIELLEYLIPEYVNPQTRGPMLKEVTGMKISK